MLQVLTTAMPKGSHPMSNRYGAKHQAERRRIAPDVQAGRAYCRQPICLEELAGRGRWIRPGSPWDLGHNDAGTAWIGATHRRCNQEAGARKGGRTTATRTRGRPRRPRRPTAQQARRTTPRHSRRWT